MTTSKHYADYGAVAGEITPSADDTHDLGTATVAWQDGYFDGNVYTDTIAEHTAATGVTIDGVKLKDNNVELATGKTARTDTGETLGAAATTFAVTGEAMTITGDGGGNTVATITGGTTGQILILKFVDANVTVTDTDAHTANTVDLAGVATDLTSADDTTLTIFFDGTSWYELARSVN